LYHTYLAEVYVAEQNYDQAVQEFQIALNIEPDNIFIQNKYRELLELMDSQ
jgi:Tfp pilus assembly protein PilF